MNLTEIYAVINDGLKGSLIWNEDIEIKFINDGGEVDYIICKVEKIKKTEEEIKNSSGMYPPTHKAIVTFNTRSRPSEAIVPHKEIPTTQS